MDEYLSSIWIGGTVRTAGGESSTSMWDRCDDGRGSDVIFALIARSRGFDTPVTQCGEVA